MWLVTAASKCSNAYTPTLGTDNTANVFFGGHSSSSNTGLFMLNWQLMKTPLSFSPRLEAEENESFSPWLFCNHNFPHTTWNFKCFFLQVVHADASTPPYLLPSVSYMTSSRSTQQFEFMYQCCTVYLQLPLLWITGAQYQKVCIPLHFIRANNLFLFHIWKLTTYFPTAMFILPKEGSLMFWKKCYFKYAETVILVHVQFFITVSAKQFQQLFQQDFKSMVPIQARTSLQVLHFLPVTDPHLSSSTDKNVPTHWKKENKV